MLNFITPYIEKNTLGVKTAGGFYSYPQPEYQQEEFLAGQENFSTVYQALMAVLITHAIVIANNGVAEPEEIDRAWMASMSLAQGPFGALDAMGIDAFLGACSELVEKGLLAGELAECVEAYLQPAPPLPG